MSYYVYILANWNNKVLYIGVTNNLIRRVYEHKNKVSDGFTSKYNVNKLVYFEVTTNVYSAISREKISRLKRSSASLRALLPMRRASSGWSAM